MKVLKYKMIIIILIVQFIHIFYISENVLANDLPSEKGALGDVSWYIDDSRMPERVLYYTRGALVYGHKFGFLKNLNSCESDIAWLILSSSSKEVRDLQGETVLVELDFDNRIIEIELNLLFVGTIGFTEVMYLSNWVAGKELIDTLSESENVKIKIIEPKELKELMDIQPDTFDLGGFNESRRKAEQKCRKEFEKHKDNHQPEEFKDLRELSQVGLVSD